MTTRPVRIALQLQPQHADYRRIRRTAAEAEDLGVDVLFNWDHFFPLDGDPTGRHFECWTMLAAWAESTSRVQLGPLVSCNSYRNPDLLADMARTVDHISEGRLVLGIGSGWFDRDFAEYGYAFTPDGSRLDDLAAALLRIERRWSLLNPAPTRRIPVLIGGAGERKTLPLVARHADIWHCFGEPDVIARKLRVLGEHCAARGRDLAEIEVSTTVTGGPTAPGEPEDLGRRLRDLGVSLFTVGASGPDYDLAPLRRWLKWRDEENS
ncbi:LLM class F420-dependent oxidoreductase [Actinoplanes cyaneus]|uniref:LLM class F420-dependent oxidoreductase n=1 Tax=Actinoplanes cyaneus TaxID=52696 RepID=A0A919ISZ0_9ACTN|nr:LLM class F420-dependent oxidoreductase [Actinoplanes cyaneus]MCW2144047.1 putative F420-dependent oxidoreductase, MSMEG_2906 family [Actinoplanes cyaneus]GID70737.1 LLM class F420-dependent oxidoreductase [Actinoplanes cyaneus]